MERLLDGAAIEPGDTVLVIGASTLAVQERVGVDGSVVAVDPDVGRLERLRALARAGGISYLIGELGVLPLMDESVDAALVQAVHAAFGGEADAARELFRVLRPGGRLSLFEPATDRELIRLLGTAGFEDVEADGMPFVTAVRLA